MLSRFIWARGHVSLGTRPRAQMRRGRGRQPPGQAIQPARLPARHCQAARNLTGSLVALGQAGPRPGPGPRLAPGPKQALAGASASGRMRAAGCRPVASKWLPPRPAGWLLAAHWRPRLSRNAKDSALNGLRTTACQCRCQTRVPSESKAGPSIPGTLKANHEMLF